MANKITPKPKKLRTTEMDRVYPLPWRQHTDGRNFTAVLAANGREVCGSLICEARTPASAERQAHALIVQSVNQNYKP
jgi:hypothetical protein